MGIEKTQELLNKFDYKFQRKNSELIVKLDYSQRIFIDFSDPNKIKITDKLVGWNFLTGLIEMSIKNAMLYNFIGAILMTFLFVYFDLEHGGMILVFFYLTYVFWVLLWTLFYLVKAETIKRTLMRWNE